MSPAASITALKAVPRMALRDFIQESGYGPTTRLETGLQPFHGTSGLLQILPANIYRLGGGPFLAPLLTVG